MAGTMNQFDGELAALRHQREMDSLGQSPGVDLILDGTDKLAETVGLPSLTGLFRKALKLGQPSVEKMVDDLESAAFEEIRRIWKHLEGDSDRQNEFEERLNSQEAQVAYMSACFHGFRTSDPEKHSRLACLTINCVFAGDLKPESLDDIMRAAVELKDADIVLLSKIYDSQRSILKHPSMDRSAWFQLIQSRWNEFVDSGALDPSKHLTYRSSFSRLESHGLIQKFREISTAAVGLEPYALLEEGKKFYERLQEIAA